MINEYVRTTRGGDRGPQEPELKTARARMAEMYESIFDSLAELLTKVIDRDFIPPHLRVVYSPLALSEMVTLGDEKYLVYDQYLGQVLNHLNRIIFTEAPIEQSDSYMCKLYALRSLALGDTRRALEYSLAFVGKREGLPQLPHIRLQERLNYTLVQEAFVVGHEFVHLLHGSNPQTTNMWGQYLIKQVKDAIERWKPLTREGETLARYLAESYIRDKDQAYVRRFGPPDLTDEERQLAIDRAVERLLKSQRQEQDDDRPDFLAWLREYPHLLEECVCDTIAAQLATIWAAFSHDLSFEKSLPAVFLGLHHLRLLKLIDLRIRARGRPGVVEWNAFTRDTQVRLWFFRMAMRGWMSGVNNVKFEEVRQVDRQFEKIIQDHYMYLFDQVYFGDFEESLEPFIASISGEDLHKPFKPGSGRDLWIFVEEVCGLR